MSDAPGRPPIPHGAFTPRSWTDPVEFAARALPFLLEHEAENCLPIGLLGSFYVLRGGAYLATIERRARSGERPAAPGAGPAGAAGSTEVAGVAMMTPPYNLILTAGTDPACLAAIADHVAAAGFQVPGVVGRTEIAKSFAALWTQRHGGTARQTMFQRVYELRAVTPAEGVPGRLRDATPDDRDLLLVWMAAFHEEALGEADPIRVAEVVDQAFETTPEGRRLFIWEVAGQPVSVAGVAGRTPNGVRIQAVYTPPELRRRGYASACVAAISQAQLDAGRTACFLFTDLSNPTSNSIYQAIGYMPVADQALYAFSPG